MGCERHGRYFEAGPNGECMLCLAEQDKPWTIEELEAVAAAATREGRFTNAFVARCLISNMRLLEWQRETELRVAQILLQKDQQQAVEDIQNEVDGGIIAKLKEAEEKKPIRFRDLKASDIVKVEPLPPPTGPMFLTHDEIEKERLKMEHDTRIRPMPPDKELKKLVKEK